MGFGAVIATGDRNVVLRDDLVNCLTEIRVEQSLDDPTRFAVQFENDICGGKFEVMDAPELQCGTMITIAVPVGSQLKCLVRGPITDASSDFMLGGPGSSYRIEGEDRRVELDRERVPHRWTGLASAAAEAILNGKFKTNIQKTKVIYGGNAQGQPVRETLNQRSTDASFLASLARDNNFCFWLEYGCRAVGDSLTVEETANFKSSPPRPENGAPESPPLLVATTTAKLRVNVAGADCPNVTTFRLKMEAERPNRFKGTHLNDREVKTRPAEAADPQPAIRKDGRRFPGDTADRDACVVTAGNEEELQARAEAALTAAGWFLNASASTTAHMLNDVLLPHDVIEVEGLGEVHGGPYQVRSVTHVINAADHYMDIELRRNAVGKV
jgi:hypothetical protein